MCGVSRTDILSTVVRVRQLFRLLPNGSGTMSKELALLSSPSSELVDKLQLEEHFEGGFFKQTEAIQDGESLGPATA